MAARVADTRLTRDSASILHHVGTERCVAFPF